MFGLREPGLATRPNAEPSRRGKSHLGERGTPLTGRRITPRGSAEFLALLATLDIETDPETSLRAFAGLLPLCREHGLTSYDAAYLELASREGIPLATQDARLRKAAENAGVAVIR